jgi:serine/threonine-protein kinase
MNGAAVFLVAFFTSAATSVGTLYLAERLHLFEAEAAPAAVAVPNLEGLPQSDAVNNLNNLGLVLMIGGREPSATLADNTIIRQSVPAGQNVNKGQAITVTLAKALPKVPTVTGKSLAQATAALLEAGYRTEQAEPIHHDTVPEGQVISQSPEPGSALAEQKSVQVTVSKGPGGVEVPKVIGLTYAKAKSTLEEKGLKVKVRWVNLAETASNVVLRQTPDAESKASKDTEVEVVINRD